MMPSVFALALLLMPACQASQGGDKGSDGGGTEGNTKGTAEASAGGETSTSTGQASGSSVGEAPGSDSDEGVRFDLEPGGPGAGSGACKVGDDGNAGVGDCQMKAPSDSFAVEVQWSWQPDPDSVAQTIPAAVALPLVANLTDDNGDGAIDLCDIPDVVVVVSTFEVTTMVFSTTYTPIATHVAVLDGATGTPHFQVEIPATEWMPTPALGDIDHDGLIEIVATQNVMDPPDGTQQHVLVAFEHDGTPKWTSTSFDIPYSFRSAVALADLDNDGDTEIMLDAHLFDHEGKHVWESSYHGFTRTPVAADLDGDRDLEVVHGPVAYQHDGSVYYDNAAIGHEYYIHPLIVNFDDDADPEVVVATSGPQPTIFVLAHDGLIQHSFPPVGAPTLSTFLFPSVAHDFDGDGTSELALGAIDGSYAVYERDGSMLWTRSGSLMGSAGSAMTAFDFLGDGSAEALYTAHGEMFAVEGGTGQVLFQAAINCCNWSQYPLVVDVDNDGSAEIVVSTSLYLISDMRTPTVVVLRDKLDRWMPTRRIWNQHTYHVTNVREDGTIPQFEPPHWKTLNTFRTNAQLENGVVCNPTPVG